jgi:DNA repair protein RecN (Recombination protein N)
MLRFLSIRRLAVIDAVEVEFGPGLNVLTGETGAGKSILVGAVGLLLGDRASADMVRTGEESAVIEAIFENDGNEIHVRREITIQGRSRAFVNGDLATAGALRELSARLIEIHGQHEHHTLLDPSTHLATLDTIGALESQAASTAGTFAVLMERRAVLARHKAAAADRHSRLELITFQHDELQKAQLNAADEDATLGASRAVLMNADRIQRLCREAYESLYDDDGSVLGRLGGVWRRVGELAALDDQFQPYVEARDGLKSQLEDLAAFLRRYGDGVEASPARLQAVEDRLALLERLKRKYGPTLSDVIARRDALAAEVSEADQGVGTLGELQSAYDDARAAYQKSADELTTARRQVAASLPSALEALLDELAMKNTRFDVRFSPAAAEDGWTPHGVDRVEFFVATNPGEELRPLARTASGGELSRIMLALRTLTAVSRSGFSHDAGRPPSASAPGLIFDEVDAGIGGRVADAVGRKLWALGSAFQVLCITHLPQIAAYADVQYQIDKKIEGGRTRTTVTRLNEDSRVEELSRMLGGSVITDAVRASAREMLGRRSTSNVQTTAASRQAGAKAKGESETSRRAKGPRR